MALLAAAAAGVVGWLVALWATARADRWGLEGHLVPAWRGWLAVAAGLALSVAVVLDHPAGGVAVWAAVLAAGADLKDRVIPHRWLVVMLVAAAVRVLSGTVALEPDVLLGIGLGVFFLGAHLLSRGGFGMGDVKLGVATGLVLGWPAGLSGVVLGLFLGGMYGTGLVVARRATFREGIPLGPFLTLGLAAAVLLSFA
jgi:Flp pilus assembly protein protease CpaA